MNFNKAFNNLKMKFKLFNKTDEEKIPHGYTCYGISINGDGKTIYTCPFYKKNLKGDVYCSCMKEYSDAFIDDLWNMVKICRMNMENFRAKKK